MSTLYVTEPPTDGKVILYTPKGEIEIELWSREVPKACRNFIALTLEGYYDNLVWHRIVPGFIVQTGDPTGTGHGASFSYVFALLMQITLDSTPELQNKHTIFGRVAGSTIYNVLALANVEMSESEPDRPVYPPKLNRAEVVHNPFPDLVPRITREERQSQERAKALAAERAESLQRKTKRPKKNVTLLSFGAEEDVPQSSSSRKPMSSHDLLEDKRLSKKTHVGERSDQAQALERTSLPIRARPADHDDPDAKDAAKDKPEQVLAHNPKQASGRDLIKSIVQQYKQDKKNAKSDKDADMLVMLDSFRTKIRGKSHSPKRPTEPVSSALTASAWDDTEDMREYGADDDDNGDWRSHTFNSGGIPLKGSKDPYSIHDYQVIDSRDTRSEMAMSLGFGDEASRKAHEETARRKILRKEGRRGRDWV
ncbi:peptidylprolyl isomerase [Malassezia nana]|uniref:Peptidylprolyl isomerase n=1 Tax=Malassezia nana TaxID=180528 RepID=A0AAF0J330_9BASI|nr:peptidylprolyl isomerase [Malassezia nana]